MRLSDLVGKEIVNIFDGARLGVIGESDLVIDIETGNIESIVLPNKGNLISMWFDKQHLVIPWESVKKIGSEVIIVELDGTHSDVNKYSL
ncbi:YlmC/YmxH family sporulation protein [Desulfitispora alkaliphila]|uniref:YlmC/YmxH family sporulation protein n=1 Tax=Desulfitispora alkaliphila TaxID=622674 RepID=UPI003D1D987F